MALSTGTNNTQPVGTTLPSSRELEGELTRTRRLSAYVRVVRNTIFTLVTVAAVAVLVATLLMPVLQIYGTSMSPTLEDSDIVVSLKEHHFQRGDIIAFYHNNKILVKRLIANPGEWVNIDEQGNVYVNGELLDEPYISEKSLGECDLQMPYQVPESRLFVMGDHRSVSVDSRSSTVGCVSEEEIVGKLVFCVWPLERFGAVN